MVTALPNYELVIYSFNHDACNDPKQLLADEKNTITGPGGKNDQVRCSRVYNHYESEEISSLELDLRPYRSNKISKPSWFSFPNDDCIFVSFSLCSHGPMFN